MQAITAKDANQVKLYENLGRWGARVGVPDLILEIT